MRNTCNWGNSQKWWTKPAGDGYEYIKTFDSNKVFDSNQRADFYVLPENGGYFQHWKFTDTGSGFYLTNRATGIQIPDKFILHDVTPEFDCPRMNNVIGN